MLELLAPAGSPEAVTAAIQAGADAVYLGYGDFNARRNAKNFSLEELASAVSYCHVRGARVYLTLNTLVTDRELPAAAQVAAQAAQVVDKCRVLYGSFAGDGATTRAITLGVRPKVVTLVNCSTMVDYVTVGVTSLGALVITDTGFQTGVSHGQGQNSTSALYLYVALV